MRIHSLYLRNFRAYSEKKFSFQEGMNVIQGPNASGKTTLLEAIYFLMGLRSFRTAHLTELIRHGESSLTVEAHFEKHGVSQKLRIDFDGKSRKVVYNSTVCQSTSQLLGLVQGVVITPDHASLVKGAPDLRRHYLDFQTAQVDPLYVRFMMRYHKALRQRNTMLRNKSTATIEMWEEEMAKAAAYLVAKRAVVMEDLDVRAARLHKDLTGDEMRLMRLDYRTSVPENLRQDCSEFYREKFAKHRGRELEVGYTLTGPHRDDVKIMLGEYDTRYYASEGQQRSCVAVLRFAEWERMATISSEMPLMLIDDIGVSLDEERRRHLFSRLESFDQSFLTTTDAPTLIATPKFLHKVLV